MKRNANGNGSVRKISVARDGKTYGGRLHTARPAEPGAGASGVKKENIYGISGQKRPI